MSKVIKTHKCKRSKKAVSEIISYVILIVIVLGISAAVYQWMLTSTPAVAESCPEDISLYVKSYSCSSEDTCSSQYCLNVIIKNNGNFNVDGFFIRASKNLSSIPITGLEYTDVNYEGIDDLKETGRFYFRMMDDGNGKPLGPGAEESLTFIYDNLFGNELELPIGDQKKISLKKIQIEPFIESKNTLLICKDATVNIEVDDSKWCTNEIQAIPGL